jgi:predicted SprT family Zn-dependent metalloprotease
MTPQQQVQEKCKQVIEAAMRLYNVDLSVVQIGFNLKGRVAGWAQWRGRMGVRSYKVRFNFDMISRGDAAALADMRDDTVPHEFAHIVCYMRPELGKNHDSGWQRVCVALGGTGKRTHDMEVVYGKGTTYEYITDRGHKVRMSDKHHRHVQAGFPLRYRKGLGTVTQTCAYSIVGIQGRTLAEPVVKQTESAVRIPPAPAVTQQVYVPTPVTPTVVARILPPAPGESKAAISRRIMLAGYNAGHSYEQIINAMIAANGYDRQLARGTFKANGPKVGIPASFYL